jgi:CRISPR-associated Csx2 family protein
MARKVFISFLGTNNYLQTKYKWPDGVESSPVRFIQEAILERTAKDWTENDRIYIFITEEAERLNWKDNGQDRAESEIEKIGLEHRLFEMGLKAQFEGVPVKEGFTEEEVWDVFNTVYSKLQPDDRIYFDITHAFRSIPLFASSLFNFAQYMKNVEVVSVNYGAFEKLGPAYKVKSTPIENRVAPIVDMTNMIRLQELTKTATSITEFGRAPKSIFNSLFLLTGKNDKNVINDIILGVSELDNNIQTNRISAIEGGQYVKKTRWRN